MYISGDVCVVHTLSLLHMSNSGQIKISFRAFLDEHVGDVFFPPLKSAAWMGADAHRYCLNSPTSFPENYIAVEATSVAVSGWEKMLLVKRRL